jgi:TRAP-type C4-dicarboxylate transport system permease small subunit
MKLTRALAGIERFLNDYVAGSILVAMMFLVCCDVVGRYVLNRPIQGTMEITSFLMVAIVYFSLARTQAIKGHIHIDILTMRLSPRTRLRLALLSNLLGIVLLGLICWQGLLSAADAWKFGEVTEGLIPFPIFPTKAVIPLGCALFVLRLAVGCLEAMETLKKVTR